MSRPQDSVRLQFRLLVCGRRLTSKPCSNATLLGKLHRQLPAGVASLLGIDAAHVNVTSVQSGAGQPPDAVSAQSLLSTPGLRRLLIHWGGGQQHDIRSLKPTQHQALDGHKNSSDAWLPGPDKHAAQPATATSPPQHFSSRQHHARMLQGSSAANVSAALAIAPGTQSNLTSISHVLTLGEAALLLQVAQQVVPS